MLRRPRVLFVIGTLSGGGAERQVIEILKHLDRSRFDPLLYVGSRRGELVREVPNDIPIFSFWEGYLGTWKSRWDWLVRTRHKTRWNHLARILEREQIDVVYDRTFLATVEAAEATSRRPTPRLSACVADPATEISLHFSRNTERGIKRAAQVYGSASRVLANSMGLKQRLIDVLQLSPEQIEVVPNIIDLERVRVLANERRHDWASDRFHLLTVGRLDENKGHLDLLQAMHILVKERGHSHLVWHVVGTGPSLTMLRQKIAELKLNDHVDLAGFVDNPFACYRSADLVCLPSHSEGLPNVLIESLACQTPVVSTDCPSGPREILDGGRFGQLVPVGHATAMANAIEAVLLDPASFREQAVNGSEYVERTYSVKVGLAQLEHIIESVVNWRE